MEAGIYVVATPIGNLDDLSPRARQVLESVDIIAAEDTRETNKLLRMAKIYDKKLVSYHDHNEGPRSEELVDLIEKDGLSLALVSDAGTPCISDPGYRLVALARKRGLKVTPIAGPSAAIALASVSGLPINRFLFVGFLPSREGQKEKEMRQWNDSHGSVIFYESPRRLISTLESIAEVWPNSVLAVGRELTKYHEEVVQGGIAEVLSWAKLKPQILGELVIIITGFVQSDESKESLRNEIVKMAKLGFLEGKSQKSLLIELANMGLDRNALYSLLLEVKEQELKEK
jgi:16S rRNA (cytidine1402-2'-O)-methyltransferase